MVICLKRGADLHMAQLMPLPLTISYFSKIQIYFTFLVPAHPGSPGKTAVKRVCVCVCVYNFVLRLLCFYCSLQWLFAKIIRTSHTAVTKIKHIWVSIQNKQPATDWYILTTVRLGHKFLHISKKDAWQTQFKILEFYVPHFLFSWRYSTQYA